VKFQIEIKIDDTSPAWEADPITETVKILQRVTRFRSTRARPDLWDATLFDSEGNRVGFAKIVDE
jgi:hypothetical protein